MILAESLHTEHQEYIFNEIFSWQVGFAVKRALGTLAYEWRSTDWTVRASVDSDGLVGAMLKRTLGGKNANLSCAISALLNHPNDKFRLGFGLTAAII